MTSPEAAPAAAPVVGTRARGCRRGCAAGLGALAAAALAAWLAGPALLRAAPDRLFLEVSPPRAADALVVLAGDHRGRRVEAAAALFRAGWVDRGPFVLSGGPIYGDVTWSRLMADHAERLGVPRARMLEQARSETTEQDARYCAPLLAGARTILLVTSPSHSARAADEFRRALPGVEVVSVPSAREGPEDWWTDPVETRALATEALKHLWPRER